jgi:hypothetical protein
LFSRHALAYPAAIGVNLHRLSPAIATGPILGCDFDPLATAAGEATLYPFDEGLSHSGGNIIDADFGSIDND